MVASLMVAAIVSSVSEPSAMVTVFVVPLAVKVPLFQVPVEKVRLPTPSDALALAKPSKTRVCDLARELTSTLWEKADAAPVSFVAVTSEPARLRKDR